MPVRALSVSRQTSLRKDRKPLGLPSVKGEQAKIAVTTGCSANDTRNFLTMSASSAKSRFTWMVLARFSAGLVDGPNRSARELELTARFERYGAPLLPVRPLERDDGAILQNRLPTEVRDKPLHQRAHAVLTLVGHRPQRVGGEEEFLVLGANPPGAGGLGTRGDPGDELVARAHGWGRCTVLAG